MLYIQVTDDSRSVGADTTAITITGPSGEKETVTLIEVSSGVYRGAIEYGDTASRTAANSKLEIAVGDQYTYLYNGIAGEQQTSVTATLAGAPAMIFFANDASYSDATTPGAYIKNTDVLYVRIIDDSKTLGTDTVTLTLAQLVEIGKPRDRETVTLVESSSGIYQGFIRYSSTDYKTMNNTYLEIGPGETIQLAYAPINEDAGPIIKFVLQGTETGIVYDSRVRIKVFQALSAQNGLTFSLPVAGTLSIYSLNGRLISRVVAESARIVRLGHVGSRKVILYRWKTAKGVKVGRLVVR
jgi:hypothetical protein